MAVIRQARVRSLTPGYSEKNPDGFRIWPWPPSGNPEDYGPNPKQRLFFLDKLSREEKIELHALGHRVFQKDGKPWGSNLAHLHPTDVLLAIGGAGSGKSLAAEARCYDTLRRFPRCKVIVGSTNLPFLKKTVLQDWKEIWTPEDADEWGHPDIRQPFVKNDLTMVLQNDATAMFLSLENRAKFLRSHKATLIHVEEGSTLEGGADDILDEFLPRLRDPHSPWKQLIITTNPEERYGPLTKRFNLKQWEEGYSGEPMPIGSPCNCQYCDKCIAKYKEEHLYTNNRCPKCNQKKPNDCPGNQYWQRVLFMYPEDNPHLPSTLASDTAGFMNAEKHSILVGGMIKERHIGAIYEEFTNKHILKKRRDLNPKLDLHWALDFNNMPQCSVISQVYQPESKQDIQILAAEEIVLPNKSAKTVVREFVRRIRALMPEWNRTVWIYGDASGWTGATDDGVQHNYGLIFEYLEACKINYQVCVPTKNPSIQLRWDSVNQFLKEKRIFVNPDLDWLIASLKETKCSASGLKEDETRDQQFRRKIKDTNVPMGLTHPAVAFGYMIAYNWPIIETSSQRPYIITADGRLLEFSENDVTEFDSDFIYSDDDGLDLDAELEDPEYDPYIPKGIGAEWREQGLLGY